MGETPNPAASLHPPAAGGSKYQTLMELGRGGTAVVHAALARGLGGFSKLVVLKMTRQELADHPEGVRMFLNEARLSARMNHPNVVQVYEVFEDQGLPVIVMEYLEGQSFATLLRRVYSEGGTESVNFGLSVLCKALEGLHYAHSLTDFSGRPLKIIHRDVTPHNIIVTYDGQVKLLDFGIAKLDAGSGQTRTGIIKGKLGYMPREQIDGSEMDCRTDIFAIGVIMWEVVARQRMWGTLSDAAVMKHLLCDDIPRLREARPDIDEDLEKLINKAIAPEPDDRYATAHELLLALTAYLEKNGGVASQMSIADTVNRTCADLKAEARKRLDRELSKFAQSADGNWNDVPAEFTGSGPRPSPGPDQDRSASWKRQPTDTGTRTGFAGQTQSTPPQPKPRRWPLVAALSVTALGAVIAWQTTRQPPAVTASAPVVVPAPAAAPAARVKVVVKATPDSAELYLDGVRISNPYETTMLADDREHDLKVSANGFLPVTRQFKLDADIEMVVALEPSAPVNALAASEDTASTTETPSSASSQDTRKRPRARRMPARPANVEKPADTPVAATPPKPANDICSPPYFIENGIKLYKRECLNRQ